VPIQELFSETLKLFEHVHNWEIDTKIVDELLKVLNIEDINGIIPTVQSLVNFANTNSA